MTTTYIVPDEGWRLDHVAKAVYGTEQQGTTEALLEANPGLAELGPTLTPGMAIVVPDIARPELADLPSAQPWD